MDLSVLRERINDIDDQMVRLFVERMKVASEIASEKAEKTAAPRQPRSFRSTAVIAIRSPIAPI